MLVFAFTLHNSIGHLLGMMKEIVRHVVAHVSKDSPGVDRHSRIPVVKEESMR